MAVIYGNNHSWNQRSSFKGLRSIFTDLERNQSDLDAHLPIDFTNFALQYTVYLSTVNSIQKWVFENLHYA